VKVLQTKLQSTKEDLEVIQLKTKLSKANRRLAELQPTEEEVKQLGTKLTKANERLVELWQKIVSSW